MDTTNIARTTLKTGIVIDVALTLATLPFLPLSLQILSIGHSIMKISANLILIYLFKEDEGFTPSPTITIHPLLLF